MKAYDHIEHGQEQQRVFGHFDIVAGESLAAAMDELRS
jgi:hypothetical protein